MPQSQRRRQAAQYGEDHCSTARTSQRLRSSIGSSPRSVDHARSTPLHAAVSTVSPATSASTIDAIRRPFASARSKLHVSKAGESSAHKRARTLRPVWKPTKR